MVTADYYYPDWGCWVNFFVIHRVEKLLEGDWTHNLRSLFSVRCLWLLSHGDPIRVHYLPKFFILFHRYFPIIFISMLNNSNAVAPHTNLHTQTYLQYPFKPFAIYQLPCTSPWLWSRYFLTQPEEICLTWHHIKKENCPFGGKFSRSGVRWSDSTQPE